LDKLKWNRTPTYFSSNFDGTELHPIFLPTLMDFDRNQPIKVQFRVDIIFYQNKSTLEKKNNQAAKHRKTKILAR
jgi:hypothetical protein